MDSEIKARVKRTPIQIEPRKWILKRKTLGAQYSYSSPLLDEGFPPFLVNKRTPTPNVTGDERSDPKFAFNSRFFSALSCYACNELLVIYYTSPFRFITINLPINISAQ